MDPFKATGGPRCYPIWNHWSFITCVSGMCVSWHMCCCMKKRDKTYGPHQLHLTKKVAGGFAGASLHDVDYGFQCIIIKANCPISLCLCVSCL